MPLPELTPDYALRFNYYHHSNFNYSPPSQKIFEKTVLRPMQNKLMAVIKDESVSMEEKEAARQRFTLLDTGLAMPPKVTAGVAVQTATDSVLGIDDKEPIKLEEAICTAQSEGLFFQPRTFFGKKCAEEDELLVENYKTIIGKVIEHAVLGLQEAMARENRFIGETIYEGRFPGNELPYQTRPDYARRGDLKTQWPTLKKEKIDPEKPDKPREFTNKTLSSLPKSLTDKYFKGHLRQVAGFWKLNGGLPPFLVYANQTNYKVFTPEDTPELRDDYLEGVIEEMARENRAVEEILKAAKDQEHLFKMLMPEWSRDLSWGYHPEVMRIARETLK